MVIAPPRLLILSFYYPPDLSAGSFRCAALVEAIRALDPTFAIDVVTTHPNRYQSFASSASSTETDGNLSVTRIPLPPHASGMRDQARAFATYAREVRRRTAGMSYSAVYGTSSRLMTAALAAHVARRMQAPLMLDIRDIFVDTIGDVLPKALSVPMQLVFGALERWTITRASSVNLVSEGFREYFEQRFPHQRFTFLTNGVDTLFETAAPGPRKTRPMGPVRILYAGNIGEGQGLHEVVPRMMSRLRGSAVLRVIGDGGRRTQLEAAVRSAGLDGVVSIVPPMPRVALLEEYFGADVLFLHLNEYRAFEKVLPSKIFEYAALGKPILAGVGGHAARFIRAEVENAAVFTPCDGDAGALALESLELRDVRRTAFLNRFRRATIMRSLASQLLALAQGSSSERVATGQAGTSAA